MKKQMEEMERRMLQAISGQAAPRQNFNSQRAGQAKGVRTSADEELQDDNVSMMPRRDSSVFSNAGDISSR